jgi:hypothetical protein
MEGALLVLLGWALGILGGPIAEYVRRAHRRKDVWNAVKAELMECRAMMSVIAYQLRSQIGEIDHQFLDWYLPIERAKEVTGSNPQRLHAIENLHKLTPEQLTQLHSNQVGQGSSLTLKTYALPLIDAGLLPELILLSPSIRREVLSIREQLGFINQDVPRMMALHDRTFDSSLTTANRVLIQQELTIGYRKLSERAQHIADRVKHLIDNATRQESR